MQKVNKIHGHCQKFTSYQPARYRFLVQIKRNFKAVSGNSLGSLNTDKFYKVDNIDFKDQTCFIQHNEENSNMIASMYMRSMEETLWSGQG